jgi:hypothetical protein
MLLVEKSLKEYAAKGRFSEDDVALYPTYLIMLSGYLPYF